MAVEPFARRLRERRAVALGIRYVGLAPVSVVVPLRVSMDVIMLCCGGADGICARRCR